VIRGAMRRPVKDEKVQLDEEESMLVNNWLLFLW